MAAEVGEEGHKLELADQWNQPAAVSADPEG